MTHFPVGAAEGSEDDIADTPPFAAFGSSYKCDTHL
jgi:hypothetical protein